MGHFLSIGSPYLLFPSFDIVTNDGTLFRAEKEPFPVLLLLRLFPSLDIVRTACNNCIGDNGSSLSVSPRLFFPSPVTLCEVDDNCIGDNGSSSSVFPRLFFPSPVTLCEVEDNCIGDKGS